MPQFFVAAPCSGYQLFEHLFISAVTGCRFAILFSGASLISLLGVPFGSGAFCVLLVCGHSWLSLFLDNAGFVLASICLIWHDWRVLDKNHIKDGAILYEGAGMLTTPPVSVQYTFLKPLPMQTAALGYSPVRGLLYHPC